MELSTKDAESIISAPVTDDFCGIRDKMAMLLMYRAGLRNGEVCSLPMEDVDLENEFVYVANGDRVIPLHRDILDWAKVYLPIRPPSDFFICTKKGTSVLPRFLKKVVGRYAKQAGVIIHSGQKSKIPSCKDLRDYCLSDWGRQGMEIMELSRQAGNKKLDTAVKFIHSYRG